MSKVVIVDKVVIKHVIIDIDYIDENKCMILWNLFEEYIESIFFEEEEVLSTSNAWTNHI